MPTYKQLMDRAEKLIRQAKKVRKSEIAAIVAEIRTKKAEHGISLQDLRASSQKRQKQTGRTRGAAKYRDPASGQTWSGGGVVLRGGWLRQKRLENGESISEHLPDANRVPSPVKILITGAAGFIGYTLCDALLRRGADVLGLDNLNNYYDVRLKEARLQRLKAGPRFSFARLDISCRNEIATLFSTHNFDAVVHLAAQAGVRYSIENPHAYADANLIGFLNILEGCRHSKVGHLVYASSSSVYGSNLKLPFSENDNVDHPISLYAATKKANELMAHSYAHLYGLPCTGLRLFTAYGPWGRPDMALFKFTRGILAGEPIPVFNRGEMVRDFTYIDDVVEGIVRVIGQPAAPDPQFDPLSPAASTSRAPYRIYNIGNNRPLKLMRYIEVLEQCLGKKAKLDLLPMQLGDVPSTVANVSALEEAVAFCPATPIEVGVERFVEWYRSYYKA